MTWQVNSTESPAFQDPDATVTDVIFGAKIEDFTEYSCII